jgi:hypothetical protein
MSPAFELGLAIVGFLSLFLSGTLGLLISQMNVTMKAGLEAQANATKDLMSRVVRIEDHFLNRHRKND